MVSPFSRFHDHTHTHTHTALCRTPLDKWSARRRDLYLTNRNIHKIRTFIASVGFEPAIPSSERPQTYALDNAATLYSLQKQNWNEEFISCFHVLLEHPIFHAHPPFHHCSGNLSWLLLPCSMCQYLWFPTLDTKISKLQHPRLLSVG